MNQVTHHDVEVSLLSRGRQGKRSVVPLKTISQQARSSCKPTHVVAGTEALVDDHEKTVVAVSLLEERRNVSLTSSGEDLFLIESMGEDQSSLWLEALLEEMCDSLPYRKCQPDSKKTSDGSHCATTKVLSSEAPLPHTNSSST